MDLWRYYDVTHQGHDILNPSSPSRIDELGEVLRLTAASRVLDIGCGHGELLLRWHEAHGITGIGVDASPYHAERARRRVAEREAAASLEIVHGRGEAFTTHERFDVACCLGASWIWNGHRGTLAALGALVKRGGAVVVGEPYWKEEPPDEYLLVEEVARDDFHDLAGCHRVARELGFELVWMAGSTEAEWDAYEMRQSAALDAFAAEHPDDEDLTAIREKRRRHDEAYFRWGRRCLGWAHWAFRAPGEEA